MSPAAALAGAVGLLLLTGLLAAAETIAERLSLVRALRLEEDAEPGAVALLWLVEHRTTTRNVVLVSTVVVRVVYAVVVALAVVGRGPLLGTGIVTVAVLATLVLGEVAARMLTLRHLERTGLQLAPGLRVLVRLVDPLARLLVALGRRLVTGRSESSGPYPSDEQVHHLLHAHEDEDVDLDDDERAMITSILELGDTVVREIMVPRPDMVTVDSEDELRDVIETVVEHGRSRIPVRRGSEDQIMGIVHAKDVLARLARRPGSGRWLDLVRQAHFVPETKRVDRLLAELRDAAIHQAIVVDEYGSVTGLVTIEDVLEEIVGEIVDEHDDEAPMIDALDADRWALDARLAVVALDELLEVTLPHDEWDTVGGLVFGLLGHVPTEGETVDLQGLRFTAERVQGRRIARVHVERLSVQPEQTIQETA